jgi:hypothetical protein
MLAMFVNDHRNDWDYHLPFVMMAYRSTVHASTKCTPNLLMFGRDITLPVDIMYGDPPHSCEFACPSEYVEWLRHSMSLSHKQVSEQLQIAASRQNKCYSKGLKPSSYSENELVWRWYPPTANVKLGLGWVGPYKVLKKVTKVTYQVEHTVSKKQVVVHVDHLKKYNGPATQYNLEQPELEADLIPGSLPLTEEIGSTDNTAVDPSLMDNVDLSDPPEVDVLDPPLAETPYRTRVGRRVKPKQIFSPT